MTHIFLYIIYYRSRVSVDIHFGIGWIEVITYFGEAVDPFGDGFSGEVGANVSAEMVAVLDDEMVGIAVVPHGLPLHELPNLSRVQTRRPNEYRFPELESRALPRLHLENPARRIVVSSKCIFNSVD